MGVISRVREWLLMRRVEAEIKKDPWLHSVFTYARRLLTDPDYIGVNPLLPYLQHDISQFMKERYASAIAK